MNAMAVTPKCMLMAMLASQLMLSTGLVCADEATAPVPATKQESASQPASDVQTSDDPNAGAAANNQVATQRNEEPQKEETPKFNIFEFVVEGNTVLPATEVEQAIYPFLGEDKTVEDVEKARVALEKTFNKAGYLTVFVNIPEQSVTEGLVKLEVLEGKVERLKVLGAKHNSLGRIKSKVSEFAEGKVPFFPKVQKQIASVNTGQDRVVAPVLRPGKTPGMVEVDLKVDDKLPLHANIEYNDRYSPNTTKTRLNGNLRYDNLWQRDHSLSVGFQVTPEDTKQTKVFSGTYVMPMDGDYLALYGVVSDSDISAVGSINVIGNGNIIGLRYIHALPILENYNHNLTVGVDYKDFKEATQVLGADGFNTPIRYMPFLIGYGSTYNTPSSTSKLDLNFNFSVRGLVNDVKEFADKRFLATPNYAFLRGELEHTYRFNQWELYGSLGGQATGYSLISNEQYGVGGLDTVRGYMESNALGDQGANATVEIRTPSLAKYMPSMVQQMQLLAFYDYGYAKVRDTLPLQLEKFYLASTGFGLNLKANKGLFVQLDYARALRSVQFVEKGDERVHFRVGFDW
jgi:hemolysin activation/secretion protein